MKLIRIKYPSITQTQYEKLVDELYDAAPIIYEADYRTDMYANAPYLTPEKLVADYRVRGRKPQPEDQDFVWETDKGELYKLSEMATNHLFFAFRMLFNHSVPPVFRIGKFKRHSNVFTWSKDYRYQALYNMAEELEIRTDLEEWQIAELTDAEENSKVLHALGI